MKLLVEVNHKEHLPIQNVDGIILPLEGYAVESITYFSMEEIQDIIQNSSSEVFVKMNRNFFNDDIKKLTTILKDLDQMNIAGILFYDLALLELKQELKLSVDLVWNQTHMVHNYRTCDYYYSRGVKYAVLGKELTLEEIKEILKKSKITSMVEVVSRPSIAFSRRKLLTNYGKDLGVDVSSSMDIEEKVSKEKIHVIEGSDGTSFFLDTIMNGTSIIHDLYVEDCPYIIIKEYGIEDCFMELVTDTMDYIHGGCCDNQYIEKYRKLGDYTNFFFKKTIYKVK